MRSTLAALALAVAVAIGLAVPAATPVRADDTAAAPSGPKVVIVVGATHGATAKYRDYADQAYAEAISYTSNVHKVYSPNATWTAVTQRGRRGIDRHLLRPRQRLAQPVHLRPGLQDQGRLRPERHRRRRRREHQVLRRAVGRDAGPGPERDRPAPPPVLRLGQLGARTRGAERGDRARSGSTTTAPGSCARTPGPSSPTAIAGRSTTCGRSSRPTSPSSSCGGPRRAPTATSSSFASTRTSGMTAFTDPETPTTGFYRSLVGDPRLMTNQITSGFSVPGRAAPEGRRRAAVRGAARSPTRRRSTPVAVLPAAHPPQGPRDRLGHRRDAVFRVEGLDDPGHHRLHHRPRTSTRATAGRPPSSSTSGGGGKTYSAAAKGTHTLSGTFNEGASWTVTHQARDDRRSRPARAAARRSA